VITGSWLNAADRGGQPQGVTGKFVRQRSNLPESFQQLDQDYKQVLNPEIFAVKNIMDLGKSLTITPVVQGEELYWPVVCKR